MSGKPIPDFSFLDDCIFLSTFSGNKRWKSKDGSRLFTWDSLHGEIEVFNKRGKHLGVLSPYGNLIKPAKKGRTIDV
ncbi:MAG: hypothetical protein EOP42_11845 [Sphingobacteriaceae bacterium]|nr:MAG: hypothetical protein EOP42_11845 [Sphingobacteriaceae bacterium]